MKKNAKNMKEIPKINFGTVKRLIKYALADFKLPIIAVFSLIAISSLINVAPSIYIKTIASYIEQGLEQVRAGGVPAEVYSAMAPQIIRTILTMIAIYGVGLIVITLYTQIGAYLTQAFMSKMRERMFERMQKLPIKYFDTHNHGDVMSHYTNDIDTLRELVSQSLPSLFQSSLMLITLFVIMLYYSVWLTLVVIAGVIGMLFVTKFIGGTSAKYFVRQQKTIGKVEGFVEEMMHGQKVVKVFCHEKEAERDFDKLNEQYCADSTNANKFANILMPIMGNIGNTLYVLVAFVGGALLIGGAVNPSLNWLINGPEHRMLEIAVVVSFLGMTRQFSNQITQLTNQVNAIAMAMAGAERVFSLLDEEPETDDGYVTLVNAKYDINGELTETDEHTGIWAWKHPHSSDGSVTYTKLEGDIVFDNVDFAYEEGKIVLHDITLYANPGQKVALVGATGAGKTTITNLINRFYDLADGKVRYDGININKIKKADLRRSLGIVLQDVNLFTGTVMDNIRYGRLDATDEECVAAAKLANADSFIRMLPDGYNTMLEGDGSGLSQGQRQLLSIARAAVADPPVMILDEATSSIDTRTEAIVQKGMDALMKGRTVFVIAHRLSTVRNSDVIMVLDHGRIIERGNHEKLIAEKGTYYRLYTGAFELE